jgi:hypothetical protein
VSGEARGRAFDALASEMARGTLSRGRMLRLMGAALVGGTLGSLGIREAGADDLCKPTGKKCNKDAQCCSGNCSRSGTSRFGTCAAADNTCSPGGSCGEAQTCLGDAECVCFQTVEGTGFCHRDQPCEGSQTCTRTADCPTGYACVAVSCCGEPAICLRPCAGTGGLAAARAAGPTTTGR